jgi:molybdate transport system substrate-binding protein
MKRLCFLTLLLIIFVTACGTAISSTPEPAPAQTLTVFAAASLTDAFTEIGAKFDSVNPGVTTTFNFGGSQALRTQIEEGAPADVFASASGKEMDALVADGFVAQDVAKVFLSNRLILILPADNPAAIETLGDLAEPGVKLVLAAEEVPVGNYARQALDLMNESYGSDFKDKVLANVVSNEDNVKQVVAKVQLGEADAGIVYASDAVVVSDLKTIEIPAELNVIANYPIASLAHSESTVIAVKFVDYVLSTEGQAILQKWGFTPAE